MQITSRQIDKGGETRMKRFGLGSALYLLALLVAATGAAFGQLLLSEEVVLQQRGTKPLFPMDPYWWSIVPGVLLFILSGVLFSVAVRRAVSTVQQESRDDIRREGSRLVVYQIAFGLVGLALTIYLAVELLATKYSLEFPFVLVVSLLALGAAFFCTDIRRGVAIVSVKWPRLQTWLVAEMVYFLALAALFFYLNARDLTNAYYSAIGDEYAFFGVAKSIALGAPVNLFSQKGVYGYHPLADSAFQALVMNLFGINHFGWKVACVVAAVVGLLPLYFLVRHLFGAWAAAVATAIVATSHYFFAYVHGGYNNIHSVPPVLASALAAAIGISRKSSGLLFVAGALAGFGFYTFFAARFAIAALLLSVLAAEIRWSTVRMLLAASAGFVVAVVPLFAVNKMSVIDAMLLNSAAKGEISFTALAEQIVSGSIRSLLGFGYNTTLGHFISGSLLDPVSFALAAVGLVFLLLRFFDWRSRFILIWLAVGLVVTGGFPQEKGVAWSRLLVVLPFLAVAAGFATSAFVRAFIWHSGSRVLKAVMPPVVVALLLLVLLPLNLERFLVTTPSRVHLMGESLAIEAALAADLDHSVFSSAMVLAPGPEAFAKPVFDSYVLGPRNPVFLNGEQKSLASLYADSPTIVLIGTTRAEDNVILSALQRVAPQAYMVDKWDRAHKGRITILTNPQPVETSKLLPPGAPAGLRAVMRLGGLGRDEGTFNSPQDVEVDSLGFLYVADTKNNRVQRFDAGGRVSTVYGGAPGSDAYLKSPVSVAVDSSQGIAVLDAGALDIKRFTDDGRFLGRIGREWGMVRPLGIVFDSQGNLWVADVGRVLKTSSEGQVIAAVTSGFGGDSRLRLGEITDVSADANGYVYAVDGGTGVISRLDTQGRLVAQLSTPARNGPAYPRLGIARDGSVVLSAPQTRMVLKYSATGQAQGAYSGKSLLGTRLEALSGIAADGKGNIYILDATLHELVKLAFY